MAHRGSGSPYDPGFIHERDLPSHVYVIAYAHSDGARWPTKVGRARSPEQRLSMLQNGNPNELVLCGQLVFKRMRDAQSLERAFLAAFRDKRIRGEWYAIDPLDALQWLHANSAPGGINAANV